MDDTFGGGLDAYKFGVTIEANSTKELGGLEFLENGKWNQKHHLDQLFLLRKLWLQGEHL